MSIPALSPSQLDKSIHTVRGQRVMLDEDLAKLYGVPTKAFNQAVKRNQDRFPEDFRLQLTAEEVAALRSQSVTSKGKGGRRYLPWAFTQEGIAMLSSVLSSPRAVSVNIEIMRAFVRMRRALTTHAEVLRRLGLVEAVVNEQSAKLGQHKAETKRDIDRLYLILNRLAKHIEPGDEDGEPTPAVGFQLDS